MNITEEEVLELHAKTTGKLSINSTVKIDSREVLSKVYTPGVGKVCMAIKDNPELHKKYTIAGKTIAVISDGTAVLGFGNIGAKAAMPVMEGKAAIFKEFGGVDAFPICIEETDTEEIIKTIKRIANNFAAINLEDFAAPQCFEIEDRLQQELDIPVMHDDQHGTAIVTLAALKGAIDLTGKTNLKIVISGAGAAGTAIAKLLYKSVLSIEWIKIVDSKGVIASSRDDLNPHKVKLAELTKQMKTQSLAEALHGADVFIGVSAPNILTKEMVVTMTKDPIIFAMANPIPEIMPEVALEAGVGIMATGRSDFPNQINNALAYPGVFKGLLESGIKKATDEVKMAAVNAIYNYHKPKLSKDNILPSILDKEIPKVIAEAISKL